MIASAIITIKDLREIEVGAVAPANPTEDMIWVDTSVEPNVEKRFVGMNLWDEVWENGDFNSSGTQRTDNDRIRTVNFISVSPQTTYYANTNTISGIKRMLFYDSNQQYLGIDNGGWAEMPNGTFTTPANAYYMKFFVAVPTYGNDISINDPSSIEHYIPHRSSPWVVVNDVAQNTVVTQLSSRLTTAEGHIDAVVDEVWPDGTSQSSAISVQAGQISSISSTVDGHTTKITQQGNALQMDAQGNSGLASRVTVAEGNISTLSSNVSGHSTAIQQNANKIALIATGDSAATLELTDAAMSFIGDNVELSANNSVNIRIGTAEQNIQDVANTAQGAVEAAEAVQTSLNATADNINAQIADHGEILSMMELTAGGLKVKTGDSIYSTLTDGEGFHVYQENTRIASFANNGVTAHSFTMGRVVCRKSSSGGWAWNLVS